MSYIEYKDKKFELSEPTFEVYSVALRELYSKGKADVIAAGKIIFDACYKGNCGTLEEIMSDVKLYISLCAAASSEVELLDCELKKK